jgi:PRC-barrel domain protein
MREMRPDADTPCPLAREIAAHSPAGAPRDRRSLTRAFLLLSLLLAAPDVAAQPAPDAAAAGPATQTIPPGRIHGVFGGHVQDSNGSDAGRLWDVLVDDDGQPRAAVIDYGGALGIGRRKVAVAWQDLHFSPGDPTQSIRLSLTRQQLGAIPEFKYGSGPTTLGDGR